MKAPVSEISICNRSYDDYIKMVEKFHGYVAPGLVLGGFMVDLAYRNLPEGEFFDAVCETSSCLPDAIQLLTPCTLGNGWLKIADLGRFALTMFEKYGGNGVRISVDAARLSAWPAINTFLFKLRPKKEQDSAALIEEIKMARTSILATQKVTVNINALKSSRRKKMAICPSCGEGYPMADWHRCLGCQGKAPYLRMEKKYAWG